MMTSQWVNVSELCGLAQTAKHLSQEANGLREMYLSSLSVAVKYLRRLDKERTPSLMLGSFIILLRMKHFH